MGGRCAEGHFTDPRNTKVEEKIKHFFTELKLNI